MTCSGVPVKRLRSSGSCVAMPTGHVLRWQARIMMQPVAISGAVAKPISSAPSIAAIDDVAAGLQLAVGLHADPRAQVVAHAASAGSRRARSPTARPRPDRGQRRGAGAAVVAGDQHVVGVRLRDARGDRADADLGDELDRDLGVRVGAAQVVDQLLEILDRVDVVVRRRRDQADARRGVADPADVLVDLVPGQLAALAGLGALRHLDLQLVGVDEVVDRDAEAAGGDLLDRRAPAIAVARSAPDPRRPRRCSTCPPSRFIASARFSCASRESEPRLIAPVAKRLTIVVHGSTSSSGIGVWSVSGSRAARAAWPAASRPRWRCARTRRSPAWPPLRTACCRSAIVSGFHMWCSPSRRHA